MKLAFKDRSSLVILACAQKTTIKDQKKDFKKYNNPIELDKSPIIQKIN